jgi:hypothetical protein
MLDTLPVLRKDLSNITTAKAYRQEEKDLGSLFIKKNFLHDPRRPAGNDISNLLKEG